MTDQPAASPSSLTEPETPADSWEEPQHPGYGSEPETPAAPIPPNMTREEALGVAYAEADNAAFAADDDWNPEDWAPTAIASLERHGYRLVEAAALAASRVHEDAGRLDRNHYDRFTAGEAEDVLEELPAWRAKYEEALTDAFVHDHAEVALTFIEEIERLRALPARPALDVEALALRRNVLIYNDYGFRGRWVAIPRSDFDRLRAEYARLAPQPEEPS